MSPFFSTTDAVVTRWMTADQQCHLSHARLLALLPAFLSFHVHCLSLICIFIVLMQGAGFLLCEIGSQFPPLP